MKSMAAKEKRSKFEINFAEDKKLAERVAAHFVPRIRVVRNNRLPLEEAWWRFFNMWNVTKDGYHDYNGRSNLYVPEVRKNVEAQARQMTKAAFPSDDCFDVGPGLTGTRKGAQAWKSFHSWSMNNCKLPLKYFIAMRQSAMLGTTPIFVPWRTEMRREFRSRRDGKKVLPKKQEVELFNGPDFMTRDLFRWYVFNPKKNNLDDGCFEIMPISPNELAALERKGDLANFEDIKVGPSNAYLMEEFARDIMRAESMGIQLQYNMAYAGEAELRKEGDDSFADTTFMKCTIYADMIFPEACEEDEDPDEPIPMRVDLYNNTTCGLIRRNEFYHQRPPYVVGKYIQPPTEDDFYGQGIPWAIQYMQYEMNSKAEQGMDSATLALNPIAIIDPGLAGASNEFNIEPGATWWANPQGVKLATMPDVTPIARAAIADLRAQMQDYSDRSPALPPQLLGKSRTATQSEIVFDTLGVDNWLFQLQNEHLILNPLLEMWESLVDQNMKEKQLIMILGRRAGDLKRTLIARSDLIGRYAYTWKGASSAANKQIVARQMLDGLKVIGSLPPGSVPNFNYAEVFSVLWNDMWNLPNGERILGTPEEMVAQDAEAENEMVGMGLEIEVLPNDDDKGHIQSHDKFLGETKDEVQKLLMQTHVLEHQKADKQKEMAAQQQQQMQQMQMQMAMSQAQGGGQRKPGSGNRTQLSPNGSIGNMASGVRA